jgi:hypothetical protein
MHNRWIARGRLFAAGAVLVAVVCSTSVAFAFTDIGGLADLPPQNTQRAMSLPSGELLVGPFSTSDHVVYKFLFEAGVRVDLTLSHGSGSFGISVFPEGTASVIGGDALAYTGFGESQRILGFTAPYSGIYYVDVNASPVGSSGNFNLSYSSRLGTDLVLDPVKNIAFGGTAKIAGHVTGEAPGDVLDGDVLLSYSFDGLSYHPKASQPLVDGAFEFSVNPQEKWYFKVQYLGNGVYDPSADKGAVSTPSFLSKVAARRYATRSYALSGTLGTALVMDTTVAAPVRVYLWRYVSGHWKAAGYRAAGASGKAGLIAAYSTKYKFPYAGKWRMQAYHSDAAHLATRSVYTYLTVK